MVLFRDGAIRVSDSAETPPGGAVPFNAVQLGIFRWDYSRFVRTILWMSGRTKPYGL